MNSSTKGYADANDDITITGNDVTWMIAWMPMYAAADPQAAAARVRG